MGNPKIGRFSEKKVLPPTVIEAIPGGPAPDPIITGEELGTVHDFRELTEPLHVAPEPPQCLLKKFKQNDLVWRWLSEPQVDKLGMRMYITYSPDARERELINSGRDAPAGVRVDAENRVKWLDDAFLGVLHRRYFLQRQAMKQQKIKNLTDQSRDHSALKDRASRVKGVVDVDVQRWEADELDDRVPGGR